MAVEDKRETGTLEGALKASGGVHPQFAQGVVLHHGIESDEVARRKRRLERFENRDCWRSAHVVRRWVAFKGDAEQGDFGRPWKLVGPLAVLLEERRDVAGLPFVRGAGRDRDFRQNPELLHA